MCQICTLASRYQRPNQQKPLLSETGSFSAFINKAITRKTKGVTYEQSDPSISTELANKRLPPNPVNDCHD
jgi:hypothetical protein